MMSIFCTKIDNLFSATENALKDYCKSPILQDFYIERIDSFVYGCLISVFFDNLTSSNIKELNLSNEVIIEVKKRYNLILKDVSLSRNPFLSGKIIDEKYYQGFKVGVKRDFMELYKIILDIERKINYKQLKSYLKNKKIALRRVGKDRSDLGVFLFTNLLETYVRKYNTFPSKDKLARLIKICMLDGVVIYSKQLAGKLKTGSKIMLCEQRKRLAAFKERLYLKWGEPIDLLECLIRISFESVGKHRKKMMDNDKSVYNIKLDALIKIHARAVQIANEILVLLKNGYADGANARWRSLHELAVISFFLKANPEEVSGRYLEHEIVRKYKEASDYMTYCKKLGYAPISIKELNSIKERKERVCLKYGDKFQTDYGWIPSLVLKDRSFRALEKHVKLDSLRPYYNLSSDAVHSGSKGFYRLGVREQYQKKILLIGPSDYGLADPFQSVAMSLMHITACVLSMEPNFESIALMHVLDSFAREIAIKAVSIQRQLEKEEKDRKDPIRVRK